MCDVPHIYTTVGLISFGLQLKWCLYGTEIEHIGTNIRQESLCIDLALK